MTDFTQALREYQTRAEQSPYPEGREQSILVNRFLTLAEQGNAAFLRSHSPGHFTGSMLVANLEMDQVLLTLHGKLGKWLQLGGHADGDENIPRVAMRECEEESGLGSVAFFPLSGVFPTERSAFPIFDLDIHPIPARGSEPDHDHYDVRYLALADHRQPFLISEESKDLRWLPVTQAYRLCTETSMHRQFDKLAWLKKTGVHA